MLNHDVGDFTTVAKLVILQREGVSFSEINKFAKNNNSSMEGFFSTLFTSKSFKIEYLLSDFEIKCMKGLITSLVLRYQMKADSLIYTHFLKKTHRNI